VKSDYCPVAGLGTVLGLTLMNLWFCCQEGSLYRLTLITKQGALISPMLHERVYVSAVRYLGPHLKHPASVAAHLYSCLSRKEQMPSKVGDRAGYLCVPLSLHRAFCMIETFKSVLIVLI